MTRAACPTTLAEAVASLAADPELVPIAGCTDLMVAEPAALVDLPAVLDLGGVSELRGIRDVQDGAGAGEPGLEIGAGTSFAAIRDDPRVRACWPILAEAAAVVGGRQIQSRATLGGNVANASPAGDSLPVLLALDAAVGVAGPEGERWLPYRDFHVGYRETALAPGELIARLRLPAPPTGAVQRFRKVGTREAQAISKVVVAMVARVEAGRVAELRLAAGSVAATPVRFPEVEAWAAGRELDAGLAGEAGRRAAEAVEPIDDVRSTAAYRRFALAGVVRRMLTDLQATYDR